MQARVWNAYNLGQGQLRCSVATIACRMHCLRGLSPYVALPVALTIHVVFAAVFHRAVGFRPPSFQKLRGLERSQSKHETNPAPRLRPDVHSGSLGSAPQCCRVASLRANATKSTCLHNSLGGKILNNTRPEPIAPQIE